MQHFCSFAESLPIIAETPPRCQEAVQHETEEQQERSPSPTSLQWITQDEADEVINLTDDSKSTVIQQPEAYAHDIF